MQRFTVRQRGASLYEVVVSVAAMGVVSTLGAMGAADTSKIRAKPLRRSGIGFVRISHAHANPPTARNVAARIKLKTLRIRSIEY